MPKPLPDSECQGIRQARDLGLFVLLTGPRTDRKWTIYSAETGREIGYWFPKSGNYRLNDQSDKCLDRYRVLRLAAGRKVETH